MFSLWLPRLVGKGSSHKVSIPVDSNGGIFWSVQSINFNNLKKQEKKKEKRKIPEIIQNFAISKVDCFLNIISLLPIDKKF